MRSEPTEHLRALLEVEDDGVDRKGRFDDALFVFALYVAFIAARRHCPLPRAEGMLHGVLSGLPSPEADHARTEIAERFDEYLSHTQSTDAANEVGTLVALACRDLYGTDEPDFVLLGTVRLWVMSHLKIFEQFIVQAGLTA